MKKRNKSWLLIIVILIVVGIYQSVLNIKFENMPPCDKWGKENKIGTSLGERRPVVVKDDKNLLAVYEKKNSIEAVKLNFDGSVIAKKEYDKKTEFSRDIACYKENDNYHIIYISSGDEGYNLDGIVIDSDLNKISEEEEKGINSISQSGDIVVKSGENNIEVLNVDTGNTVDTEVQSVDMIAASYFNGKPVVIYMDHKKNIHIADADGESLKFDNIYSAGDISTLSYRNLNISCDNENAYILYDDFAKGEKIDTKVITFNMKDREIKDETKLNIDGDLYPECVWSGLSDNKSLFYATTDRIFGLRNSRRTVVEFSIKDGKVTDINNISRDFHTCINGYGDDDYAIYLSGGKFGEYNVNITSSSEDYKAVNNKFRKSDMINGILYTLQGIMMSIAYSIPFGLGWLLTALVIAAGINFFGYGFNSKQKLISYIVTAIFEIAFKTYTVINYIYPKRAQMMPGSFTNPILSALVCILIGVAVFFTGYKKYEDDTDRMFVISFGIYLIIDTVLTCVTFIPFVYL